VTWQLPGISVQLGRDHLGPIPLPVGHSTSGRQPRRWGRQTPPGCPGRGVRSRRPSTCRGRPGMCRRGGRRGLGPSRRFSHCRRPRAQRVRITGDDGQADMVGRGAELLMRLRSVPAPRTVKAPVATPTVNTGPDLLRNRLAPRSRMLHQERAANMAV
jgi:hypothetical protein